MKRYTDIEILKDKNGKRFRKTVLYPEIEPTENDTYITGQVGDRLDLLASKYYLDSTLWWIIARANNIGYGNLVVPIGKQIRIPANHFRIVDLYNKLNQ